MYFISFYLGRSDTANVSLISDTCLLHVFVCDAHVLILDTPSNHVISLADRKGQ